MQCRRKTLVVDDGGGVIVMQVTSKPGEVANVSTGLLYGILTDTIESPSVCGAMPCC
jgi:hypothetical protein